MGRKRANGEGSIYRRKDGRWAASVSLANGKRKHFLGRTRQEVNARLVAAQKDRQDGVPVVPAAQTLAAFLRDWLAAVWPSLRPRTQSNYEQYIRVHIVPGLGSLRLARLTPQHLQRFYADRLAAGLSPTTVRHMHGILHRSLAQAVRWGLVVRNVADLATPPRRAQHEMKTLSREQVHALLDAAGQDRLEALYVMAVTTGLREGELLGLRWQDVDLDAGSVQVRGTLQRLSTRAARELGIGHDADGHGTLVIGDTKTTKSRRQVLLSRTAVAALRRHRATQAEARLRVGAAWEDTGLVFTNDVGRPIEATNLLNRSFLPLLRRAGLPRIRFHDLRHTAATLLLAEGKHPKIVSEMLGHSQISITLDLYSHVTPTMQRDAADTMDAILAR